MSSFNTFEEIEVWQLARTFSSKVYLLTKKGDFAKDFKLRDQINDSSGSIMDNIAEGFGRNGNKEFCNFLYIAKASACESKSQLFRAFDRSHIDEKTCSDLTTDASVIISQIAGFIKYLKGSSEKGLRYRSGAKS